MKDVDEAIGRVLRGLGETEAEAGLECRVMDGLRRRAAVRREPRRFGWVVLGVSAGTLALLFVVLSGRTGIGVPDVAVRDTVVQDRAGAPPYVDDRPRENSLARSPVHPAKRERASGGASAREEWRAGTTSFPAPAMPLTGQEQLLAGATIRDEPEAATMVDVSRRREEDEAETAGFEGFFGKTEPPPQPAADLEGNQ